MCHADRSRREATQASGIIQTFYINFTVNKKKFQNDLAFALQDEETLKEYRELHDKIIGSCERNKLPADENELLIAQQETIAAMAAASAAEAAAAAAVAAKLEREREKREKLPSPEPNRAHQTVASRKISLTCQTLPRSCSVSPSPVECPRAALEAQPRRGTRLRSPAPSPIPSPIVSPVPSPYRSRFVVSRVPETSLSSTNSSASSSPLTPSSFDSPTSAQFFPPSQSSSRFRVTVIEPPSIVASDKNVTVGFHCRVVDAATGESHRHAECRSTNCESNNGQNYAATKGQQQQQQQNGDAAASEQRCMNGNDVDKSSCHSCESEAKSMDSGGGGGGGGKPLSVFDSEFWVRPRRESSPSSCLSSGDNNCNPAAAVVSSVTSVTRVPPPAGLFLGRLWQKMPLDNNQQQQPLPRRNTISLGEIKQLCRMASHGVNDLLEETKRFFSLDRRNLRGKLMPGCDFGLSLSAPQWPGNVQLLRDCSMFVGKCDSSRTMDSIIVSDTSFRIRGDEEKEDLVRIGTSNLNETTVERRRQNNDDDEEERKECRRSEDVRPTILGIDKLRISTSMDYLLPAVGVQSQQQQQQHRNSQDSGIEETPNSPVCTANKGDCFKESIDSGIDSECSSCKGSAKDSIANGDEALERNNPLERFTFEDFAEIYHEAKDDLFEDAATTTAADNAIKRPMILGASR